jgi:hypothetical protein
MKARLIPSLIALTLTAFAGAAAKADETTATLAWQEPGYVMDVVVATAPRVTPAVKPSTAVETSDYVGEVVVVTASRSDVLEARRELFAAAAASWLNRPVEARRFPLMGIPAR